jgi:hypothetical protein
MIERPNNKRAHLADPFNMDRTFWLLARLRKANQAAGLVRSALA